MLFTNGSKTNYHNLTVKVPGKIILFGEHAVVYGHPAIAIAINLFTYCTIEPSNLVKSFLNFKNYGLKFEIYPKIDENISKNSEFKQFDFILRYFQTKYKIKFAESSREFTNKKKKFDPQNSISKNSIKITLNSEIPAQSGLGSSASTSVALTHAISQYFSLNLSREEISEIAYSAERFVHGNPSGIDNSVCTYGNGVLFTPKKESARIEKPNGKSEPNIQIIQIGKIPNIHRYKFILADSGVPKKTKRAIELIKMQKAKTPDVINSILLEIHKITERGLQALKKGDFFKLGRLMNENHDCLRQLGISIKEIESIREISLKHKAIGAKLTGGGLGGFVIILAADESINEIILNLEKKGYKTYLASFNLTGSQGCQIIT